MSVSILREEDVMRARAAIRSLAKTLGFTEDRELRIVGAVAEMASNVFKHAKRGTVMFRKLGNPPGVEATAFDRGPGIRDVAAVMKTGRGLRAIEQACDDFVLDSRPEGGTTVKAIWFNAPKSSLTPRV
jgi:serine/threonine-protein kinase RsbT